MTSYATCAYYDFYHIFANACIAALNRYPLVQLIGEDGDTVALGAATQWLFGCLQLEASILVSGSSSSLEPEDGDKSSVGYQCTLQVHSFLGCLFAYRACSSAHCSCHACWKLNPSNNAARTEAKTFPVLKSLVLVARRRMVLVVLMVLTVP